MHAFSLDLVRQAFEKTASKFAKYIRSAPEESLWSAVPRILNTAGPQQFGMPLELSRSLQDLHVSRGLLDREQLLKGLRKRFESENDRQRLNATGRHEKDLLGSAGTPSKVVKDSDSLAFARAVPQNAKSETVRLMHSNDSERIRGIMEHGPSLRMDKPAQGAYGKERFGLFAHFKDNPAHTEEHRQQILSRARYYANMSAAKGGGHPATLEFDFPKALLRRSQFNEYEPVVPASLWRYAKNFSVRSEPWTGGGLMGRGVDSMQHLSGDKMQRIYDMEPGIPDIAKTRPAGIRRMEEDAAAALRNRNM